MTQNHQPNCLFNVLFSVCIDVIWFCNCIATLILNQSSKCISTASLKILRSKWHKQLTELVNHRDNAEPHRCVQFRMYCQITQNINDSQLLFLFTWNLLFYSLFFQSVNRQNEPSIVNINWSKCQSHWKTILIEWFIYVKCNSQMTIINFFFLLAINIWKYKVPLPGAHLFRRYQFPFIN